MMKPPSQGARANRHGRTAETLIESLLYDRAPHADIMHRTVIGLTVYGRALEADLYIQGLARFPDGLVIESKWQDSSGSVDEKFPYLVANIKTCYPCPVIVMAGGGGARADAIRWLKAQIDGVHLIAVLNLEELVTWCNRNL